MPGPVPHAPPILGTEVLQVKSAECQYRGISSTFAALTQAYALEIYQKPRILTWTARRQHRGAASPALVACQLATDGPKPSTFAPAHVLEARKQGAEQFEVVWQLSTLGTVRITPHNLYARDALDNFQRTIDRFYRQMALVGPQSTLRSGPGESYPIVKDLPLGTIVLEERRQGQWVYARIAESTTAGWLPQEKLLAVENQ